MKSEIRSSVVGGQLGGTRQVKSALRSPPAQPCPAAFIDCSPLCSPSTTFCSPTTHHDPPRRFPRRTMALSISTRRPVPSWDAADWWYPHGGTEYERPKKYAYHDKAQWIVESPGPKIAVNYERSPSDLLVYLAHPRFDSLSFSPPPFLVSRSPISPVLDQTCSA